MGLKLRDFECTTCGHTIELLSGDNEEPGVCPECGFHEWRRKVGKGSGFKIEGGVEAQGAFAAGRGIVSPRG